MSWIIKTPGFQLDSDDMTIAELGRVEKLGGQPWSIANPFRDVGVAKAFYQIALERSGLSRTVAEKTVNDLTLKQFKRAFEWVSDDETEEEHEEPDPSVQNQNPTIPSSSVSGLETESHPASSSKKGSATSS